MSRTRLCFATATLLAGLATATACLRHHVLGSDLHLAAAGEGFRVTLLARGQSTGQARLITQCPLLFGRQHIARESCLSDELAFEPVSSESGAQRFIRWQQPRAAADLLVRASYEFECNVSVRRPTVEMERLAKELYRGPVVGEYVAAEESIDPRHGEITRLALELTYGIDKSIDKTQALFQYVDQSIQPNLSSDYLSGTATECLRQNRGDALAKSRLLTALCRNRGIPARLVHGLTLGKHKLQRPHTWVEAWSGEDWLPLCATYHFCGRVPANFLVLCYGATPPVRGENVRDLEFTFCIEKGEADAKDGFSLPHLVFHALSVHRLPLPDWRLVEFLLLLPLAALIVCFLRNVIGLPSFGIFAPALIGMAFRETNSMLAVTLFCLLVLAGWGVRRSLDCYHLLQAPRTAVLLTLLAGFLLAAILAANQFGLTVAQYISLIPMIILAGMVERFWTLEAEENAVASFKTLLSTMIIAGIVGGVTSLPTVVACFMDYPETLGLVVAGQLLLGRYTGFRLSELLRFRDLVDEPMSGL